MFIAHRHIFAICGLILIAGCGGSTDEDDETTDEPYTGSCGLGTAAYALESGSSTESSPSFTITGEVDRSAFCAQNSGTSITLVTPTISSSATTSSESDSNLYGMSASVLAYGKSATSDSGGSITISGGDIETTSDYANAAFATGKGSNLTLYKVDISTSGEYAHAVVATKAGAATITGTSSALASLVSAAAEVVVVEGASTVSISNADLLSTNANENRGILMYDSSTGSGTSTLSITGGSYVWSSSSSSASAFYVKNQTAIISLEEVTISNPTSSALLRAVTGSVGSDVTLNASSQTLTGNIVADSASTVSLSLASSSSLSGALNTDNSGATIDLTLDSTSSLTLTANSYINELNVADCSTITYSGHYLYYKSYASGSATCSSSYLLTY